MSALAVKAEQQERQLVLAYEVPTDRRRTLGWNAAGFLARMFMRACSDIQMFGKTMYA
jgi:hypothetical protein